MIGLEVFDARVVAVMLDDGGRVLHRASADAAPDLGVAAIAALDEARQGARDSIGVASATPEAPAVAAALVAVGKRFPGVGPAITSGVAAAVAESWLGVGRGFKDVVFFAVSEHATGGIVRDGSPIDGGH